MRCGYFINPLEWDSLKTRTGMVAPSNEILFLQPQIIDLGYHDPKNVSGAQLIQRGEWVREIPKQIISSSFDKNLESLIAYARQQSENKKIDLPEYLLVLREVLNQTLEKHDNQHVWSRRLFSCCIFGLLDGKFFPKYDIIDAILQFHSLLCSLKRSLGYFFCAELLPDFFESIDPNQVLRSSQASYRAKVLICLPQDDDAAATKVGEIKHDLESHLNAISKAMKESVHVPVGDDFYSLNEISKASYLCNPRFEYFLPNEGALPEKDEIFDPLKLHEQEQKCFLKQALGSNNFVDEKYCKRVYDNFHSLSYCMSKYCQGVSRESSVLKKCSCGMFHSECLADPQANTRIASPGMWKLQPRGFSKCSMCDKIVKKVKVSPLEIISSSAMTLIYIKLVQTCFKDGDDTVWKRKLNWLILDILKEGKVLLDPNVVPKLKQIMEDLSHVFDNSKVIPMEQFYRVLDPRNGLPYEMMPSIEAIDAPRRQLYDWFRKLKFTEQQTLSVKEFIRDYLVPDDSPKKPHLLVNRTQSIFALYQAVCHKTQKISLCTHFNTFAASFGEEILQDNRFTNIAEYNPNGKKIPKTKFQRLEWSKAEHRLKGVDGCKSMGWRGILLSKRAFQECPEIKDLTAINV